MSPKSFTTIPHCSAKCISSCPLQGKGQGFPAMLTGLRQLRYLACKGCSGLNFRPFAGIASLLSLETCLLNCSLRMSDDTCADIASLTEVLFLTSHRLLSSARRMRFSFPAYRYLYNLTK